MRQNAGGNAHNMPNQATPMRTFDVENRGQSAKDRLYAVADASQDATDVLRPLVLLIVLTLTMSHWGAQVVE